MSRPELVAATYLEVANRHRKAIEDARIYTTYVVYGKSMDIARALVAIDEAMRAVIHEEHRKATPTD